MGGWALIDADQRRLSALAGGLSAWAPRIIGGEGLHVIPTTGHHQPLTALGPIAPEHGLGRVFWASERSGSIGIAAVIGAPLRYRDNLPRCVLGFIHAANLQGPGPIRLGPVLIGAAALGAVAAVPARDAASLQPDLGRHLGRLDEIYRLVTGDVVLLDPPPLSNAQSRMLLGEDLRDLLADSATAKDLVRTNHA